MTKIKGLYLEEFLAQYGLTLDSAKEEVLKKLKEEKAITVHSGPEFHQDETLGTATLLLIARNILNINPEEIEIIRTRNEKEFKGAVLDVGSTYLDHHMEPEKRAHRQDGTKYAAAGLVWAIMGNLLVPERFVENVDRKLFKPSDMADNGEGTAIMSFAEIMCPIDDNDDLMECYMETVQHYVRVLERLIKYYNKVSEKGDLTPYLKEGNDGLKEINVSGLPDTIGQMGIRTSLKYQVKTMIRSPEQLFNFMRPDNLDLTATKWVSLTVTTKLVPMLEDVHIADS
jgi:hypothetical protein